MRQGGAASAAAETDAACTAVSSVPLLICWLTAVSSSDAAHRRLPASGSAASSARSSPNSTTNGPKRGATSAKRRWTTWFERSAASACRPTAACWTPSPVNPPDGDESHRIGVRDRSRLSLAPASARIRVTGLTMFVAEDPEAAYAQALAKYRELCAKEKQAVLESGGLYILGTERHESRRIDNQLRGRSGRQGDPGRSLFYLSLEDDLMRIFGSNRMDSVLKTLGLQEGEAITHPWMNKSLEMAQKKVVVVKSMQHFHAAYAPIASEVVYVAAPGALVPDWSLLPTCENLRNSLRRSPTGIPGPWSRTVSKT